MTVYENGSTGEAGGDGEHQRKMAGINEQSAKAIERSAATERPEMIDAAFNGILAHVARQQGEMDQLVAEGLWGQAEFEWMVLQTFTRLPFRGDEPQNAFSILLAPDEKNLGQERRGEERMMVFMPVPADAVLMPGFDPNSLERPGYIMVERYDSKGTPRSYVIADNKAEEFQGAYHKGEQLTGEDAIDFSEYIGRRVNPIDVAVIEIMTDLTNWTVQVQRFDELNDESE